MTVTTTVNVKAIACVACVALFLLVGGFGVINQLYNTNESKLFVDADKLSTSSSANSGNSPSIAPTSYGIDVSWPIQGPVSSNYPSLPHNQNPGIPTPTKYKNMPLQPFGDDSRHRAYIDHLDGCRNHYAKISAAAAKTCDIYDYDRILMNKRQPQSMQNYTTVGFKKIQAPPRVKELIDDFWNKNFDKQKPEIWPEGNIYTNHWNSPTMMVSVDDNGLRGSGYMLKRKIWDNARETIQQWTNQDITPVSMYGIRVYTEGAILVPHVDRLP